MNIVRLVYWLFSDCCFNCRRKEGDYHI